MERNLASNTYLGIYPHLSPLFCQGPPACISSGCASNSPGSWNAPSSPHPHSSAVAWTFCSPWRASEAALRLMTVRYKWHWRHLERGSQNKHMKQVMHCTVERVKVQGAVLGRLRDAGLSSVDLAEPGNDLATFSRPFCSPLNFFRNSRYSRFPKPLTGSIFHRFWNWKSWMSFKQLNELQY